MVRIFTFIFVIAALLPDYSFAATKVLVSAKTTTGAGSTQSLSSVQYRVYQAYGTTSAGSGACAMKVQGSDDYTNWVDLGTITLTLGTTATNDGFASSAPWPYIRGNVASISGTNAACSLTVGY